jgi:GNAT superfamily N-acetyltransferase
VDFEIDGWEADEPTLELDHREFAYAGKFVVSNTGKAVARENKAILGAVAFSRDYSDETAVRLRYVTVRDDRRGEGIGARLLRFCADRLEDRYETVGIAVNNPVAYRACYRAGFHSTGEQTGIAELELVYDPDRDRDRSRYEMGLDVFESRDLPDAQRTCLDSSRASGPPTVVDVPE